MRWRFWSLLGILVAPTALFCTRCGSEPIVPTPDSGGDARADAVADVASEASDDASDCGSDVVAWPGWTPLTAFSACSRVEITSTPSLVPAITWIPCTNGDPSCLEVDTKTWRSDAVLQRRLGNAVVAIDSATKTGRLRISRMLTDTDPEDDVFDFPTLQPLFGIRVRESFAVTQPGPSSAAVLAYGGSDWRYLVGDPTIADAGFLTVPPGVFTNSAMFSQQQALSKNVFAFDVQLVGKVAATRDGGLVTTDADPNERLLTPRLVNDDLYARSAHPASGWGRVMQIGTDASVAPYLGKTGVHTSAFASDGVSAFWLESGGDPNPLNDPPNGALYVAPYSTNGATVTTSAIKVADVPGAFAGESVAFGGYAFVTIGRTNGYVIRASDGKVKAVSPGTGRMWGGPVYVSSSEIWSVVSTYPNGPTGIGMVRIALGGW